MCLDRGDEGDLFPVKELLRSRNRRITESSGGRSSVSASSAVGASSWRENGAGGCGRDARVASGLETSGNL
jgi:hypothetical protein